MNKRKVPRKELNVSLEDEKMIDISKIFLSEIEKEFSKFKETLDVNEKQLEKYKDSKKYIFEPEKLSKKSPLAIINAPWGTGKTHFIENFLKLFIDEELSSDTFERMLIIDAWKFSNSKDVSMEFAEEISKKLIKFNLESTNDNSNSLGFLHLVKRMAKKLMPSSISAELKIGPLKFAATKKISKDSMELEEEKYNDIYDAIVQNKTKTIIFIDNLERLGSYSWELLKAVLKMQEFENYLIVLPLNINKLSDNGVVGMNGEYPIEKYVDFPIYDFTQDYSNYFCKVFKNSKLIEQLSIIFNHDINGEKLSIREIVKLFNSSNIFSLREDRYSILKEVRFNIWDTKEIISKMVNKDIRHFIETEQKKAEIISFVYKEIISVYVEMVDQSNKEEVLKFGEIVDSYGKKINYVFGHDYTNILEKWEEKVALVQENVGNFIKKLKVKETGFQIRRNTLYRGGWTNNSSMVIDVNANISRIRNEITKYEKWNINVNNFKETISEFSDIFNNNILDKNVWNAIERTFIELKKENIIFGEESNTLKYADVILENYLFEV